jgi:hypothetical protein
MLLAHGLHFLGVENQAFAPTTDHPIVSEMGMFRQLRKMTSLSGGGWMLR